MQERIQELEPMEEEAVDNLVKSAGIRYGQITVEIQVKNGRRSRTALSVKKTTVDD
jgi:hypothetical protein